MQDAGKGLSLGSGDGYKGVGNGAQKPIEPFKGGLSGRGV